MGTNYYISKNCCSTCGRGDEPRHIGKSSGGWCFSLHVYPEDGINTLDDWRETLKEGTIADEYGNKLSPDEMLSIITERFWDNRFEKKPNGYDSWEEFHRKNYSKAGPNGLLRHAVLPGHCVGNGEGTWDYIIGDFS